jgi:hypothetical protein
MMSPEEIKLRVFADYQNKFQASAHKLGVPNGLQDNSTGMGRAYDPLVEGLLNRAIALRVEAEKLIDLAQEAAITRYQLGQYEEVTRAIVSSGSPFNISTTKGEKRRLLDDLSSVFSSFYEE